MGCRTMIRQVKSGSKMCTNIILGVVAGRGQRATSNEPPLCGEIFQYHPVPPASMTPYPTYNILLPLTRFPISSGLRLLLRHMLNGVAHGCGGWAVEMLALGPKKFSSCWVEKNWFIMWFGFLLSFLCLSHRFTSCCMWIFLPYSTSRPHLKAVCNCKCNQLNCIGVLMSTNATWAFLTYLCRQWREREG